MELPWGQLALLFGGKVPCFWVSVFLFSNGQGWREASRLSPGFSEVWLRLENSGGGGGVGGACLEEGLSPSPRPPLEAGSGWVMIPRDPGGVDLAPSTRSSPAPSQLGLQWQGVHLSWNEAFACGVQ